MHVRPLTAEDGSRAWTVRIVGPAPSERTYRFDASGRFLEMQESLNGMTRKVAQTGS
jgi:hypothetical protein